MEAIVLNQWIRTFSHEKVAEETGFSIRAIDNALSRIKSKLDKSLQDMEAREDKIPIECVNRI